MFRITFITSPMDSVYCLKQAAVIVRGEYSEAIALDFFDNYRITQQSEEKARYDCAVEQADFIFVVMHGGLSQFSGYEELINKYANSKRFFIHSGCEEEDKEALKNSGLSDLEYQDIFHYWMMGDADNYLNMILFLSNCYGSSGLEYAKVKPIQWEGVYYPETIIENVDLYIDNLQNQNKPVVGILFYSKMIQENNTDLIDCFIREIEQLGALPLAVYTAAAPDAAVGCRGLLWVIKNIFKKEGQIRVDAVINIMGYSMSLLSRPGDGGRSEDESIFSLLDVPVFQAMTTWQNYSTWESSVQGIDMLSLVGNVYYPEFDGQIITVTCACCEFLSDDIGDKIIYRPIKERVNKISRLAARWAWLRHKPGSEKKVAILFHNMPPRNDMIGAAYGLDTPAAVYDMTLAMKKEGIYLEYDFTDGEEIIKRIIAAVSNDIRWLSAEKVMEQSVDTITSQRYKQWFSQLNLPIQENMQSGWGNAPGEFMVYEGKFPVPGIINGNIFIGLQPPRGYEEQAEEIYHSTEISPPHQYFSFYRWLKEEFRADIIFHMGAHGTVEWLPGKEVGLSSSCYPDIMMDDIPHVYPYSINVISEGIQAKRRSDAVILDHLIPSMVLGGSYDEVEQIDNLIKQYYHARLADKGKLPLLQAELIEAVVSNNYHIDMHMEEQAINDYFDTFLEALHIWLEEIKNSLIKDGLHYLGRVPEKERLDNLLRALLRLSNGEVPSLLFGICKASGYDFDVLQDDPLAVDGDGRTNLMITDSMEKLCGDVIGFYGENDYGEISIQEVVNTFFPNVQKENTADLILTLNFLKDVVMPKLESTRDEMTHLIDGINGRFVPPGGGGTPTRGKVNILPSGRNFFSIDPMAVPSRASWKVGMQLADKLIQRYQKEEGIFPETVVIIVYAMEAMNTNGDDISEILYLMGIRPRWLENSDRVIGMEVISLEELGRPRVDVTLRISGLFRDTFPNLIEYIEDAVNLAAGLDESDKDNFIRRNFNKEIAELMEKGNSYEDARNEAGIRIFGDPPGTYGAGVDVLINSKKWDDYTDLGNVYTFWSGHAYGRKIHGDRVTDIFARRLAAAQITVKNESSMEIDMLDSDDFFTYHGGLIAAVRTHSGSAPRAYCGNTNDPSRVKLRDVREEIARIMRSRILNPKWFEGLKQHGYKGAQEISGMLDYVFGWDATTEAVEDWMYEKISEAFLFNDERREWIESVNPWAIHSMTERLLEAEQRGMWNAQPESLEKIRSLYMKIEGDIEEHI